MKGAQTSSQQTFDDDGDLYSWDSELEEGIKGRQAAPANAPGSSDRKERRLSVGLSELGGIACRKKLRRAGVLLSSPFETLRADFRS